MHKVFITRAILPKGLDLLEDRFEIDLWQGELPPPRWM